MFELARRCLANVFCCFVFALVAHAAALPNQITIGNPGAAAIRNYPFQFGRPFLQGAIPAGECPVVLVNGAAAASQADVKNHYPDGSAEFAVLALVVPSIPAAGTVALTFTAGPCGSNTPLSRTQLLEWPGGFHAWLTLSAPGMIQGGLPEKTLAVWQGVTNGGLSLTIAGKSYSLGGLDFSAAGSMSAVAAVIQNAMTAAHVPGAISWTGASFELRNTTVFGTGSTVSVNPSAPAGMTGIADMLGLANPDEFSPANPSAVWPGSSPSASLSTMIANGDYKLWTSGPVAQTIVAGDDSAARKYDIGFGDGHRPLRPRFYATFWPQTGQIFVRAVIENDSTSDIEDQAYKASITAGQASTATVYAADLSGTQAANPKKHWALTAWTKEFWLGGAPPAAVDIDNSLAYLESTRFIPNFDPGIDVPASAIAAEYALWSGRPHDIYDGTWDGGLWQSGMGSPGARQEIGPYPTWSVMWLYTGDWRMREMALGMADLAGAFPMQLRETTAGKRLSRADPAGSSAGLGRAVSITDRKSLVSATTTLLTSYGKTGDFVSPAGPIDTNQPWAWDNCHEPQAFYPQYILTGDPWYLEEMYLWEGFAAAADNGAATSASYGRGPTGAEGGIDGANPRCPAWIGRGRAEAAFAAPDADPEKGYFTYLMNDALARWEGSFGISGTPYDGTAEKEWGAATGNSYTGLNQVGLPPLGNWDNECGAFTLAACMPYTSQEAAWWNAGQVTGFTSPWMSWYLIYALGREKELGFAVEPILAKTAPFLIGMVASGLPEMVNSYWLPVADGNGEWFSGWPAVMATFTPNYASTATPAPANSAVANYLSDLGNEGYPAYAIAAGSMIAGEPGGAAAWNWLSTVPYPAIDWASAPKWNLVPRTDTNTLPAQPTGVP